MTWRIVVFESREAVVYKFGFVPVGAAWPAPHLLDEDSAWRNALAVPPGRVPFFVKLPDGSEFCPYMRAWNGRDGYHGEGWGVAGELPNVTVSPSINVVGHYHGWIRDGVITPDCEGRSFPHARAVPSDG